MTNYQKDGVWTAENVGFLVSLWNDGFSASQVAETLSFQFNNKFTRNMIISQLSRQKKDGVELRKGDYKERTYIQQILDMENNQCKFPIGDFGDEDFTFCLKKIEMVDSVYCDYHRSIAYQVRLKS